MSLSRATTKEIEKAAAAFATRIAVIVSRDSRDDAIAELQGALARLAGGKTAARSKRGPVRRRAAKRRKPADYGNLVSRLVVFLRANGGTVSPGAVSKEFGLTPEQRRHLVAVAAKKKVVRIEGARRNTTYSLLRSGSGKAGKRRTAKKPTQRKRRARASGRRKRR